jgi:hypothetical protein
MKNGNTVSLKTVLWKIMKHPLCSELAYEEAAEYATECLRLLGAPAAQESKLYTAELVNHKAEIPCDILKIDGVRYVDAISADVSTTNFVAMRESTNIYHINEADHIDGQNPTLGIKGDQNRAEFTYKLQKGIIFTSMREGCVQIAYRGLSLDEDGFPLIPDNEKVMLALEYYILSRYLEPIWLSGKISDKAFNYIEQKRYFYMPSAFTAMQMPDYDGAESMANAINRLISTPTAHSSFYKKLGEKERIRKWS